MASSASTSPTLTADGTETFKSVLETSAEFGKDEVYVYPLHLLDDLALNKVFVTWPMVFNDVLDMEKLKTALEQLLDLPGWRKLGGRMVAKNNHKKKHEIHVPRRFTAEEPAFSYSHARHPDLRLHEHPTAKHIPKPSHDGYTQRVFSDEHPLREFMARPDFPKNLKEMVEKRLPQLSLHITSFTDATIVSLTWPHTLMDGVGQEDLLRAWSLTLAGNIYEVPTFLGAQEDVLIGLDHSTTPKEPVAVPKLGGLQTVGVFARLILRYLRLRMKGIRRETRMVFVPKAVVSKLKQLAAADVAPGDFVSTGDTLAAWMLHALMQSQLKPKSVTVSCLVNGRYRLPWLSTPGCVYVQNIVSIANMSLNRLLTSEPLGRTAQEIRSQLKAQTTEAQVAAAMREVRHDVLRKGRPKISVCGESGALPVFFNNLTKAGFLQAAEFRPAVVSQGEDSSTRNNPLGTAVLYLHRPLHKIPDILDSFYVLGKDHAENYWLMGTALESVWQRLDNDILSLSKS